MRIRIVATALLSIALVVSGCSGGSGGSDAKPASGDTSATTVKGETPKLENDDIKAVFESISSYDVDKMERAKSFTAPGSVAAAYLQEQADAVNAAIDAGITPEAGELKKTDDGYQNCSNPSDPKDCVVWGDFESLDGKLATFTINDVDISDRISVGDGSKQKVGDLATVEFLSAYKSVQSDQVFVNIRVTSQKASLNLNTYSATYRGADKRQSTATDATGPTELTADSTAYVSLIFKTAKIGGEATLSISDEDFNTEIDAVIKTS